jgi:D-alanyl-D-alanine carboxypeptidase
MTSSSRNTFALLVACIAFIGIGASLKSAQQSAQSSAYNRGIVRIHDTIAKPIQDSSFLAPAKSEAPQEKPPVRSVPTDPVTADAYLVGDVSTGKIYLQKRAETILPFASMSKLITAFAATDQYASSTQVMITEPETMVPPDASGLKAGEKFTLSELLYPMLLNSSNVAAEAIASSSDRDHFMGEMRGYAWEVGMPDSYFADPTGLSPGNQGTASGFFALAQYLYSKRPDILAITRTPSLSVATTTDHGAHAFTSIHPYINDPRFLGGKTGHTPEALDTMITIMRLEDHPIAIIILHSSGRARDTQLLIDRVEKALRSD